MAPGDRGWRVSFRERATAKERRQISALAIEPVSARTAGAPHPAEWRPVLPSSLTPTISWNTDASGFGTWRRVEGRDHRRSRTPTASDNVLIDRGAVNPVVTVRTAGAASNLVDTESLVLATDGNLSVAGTLSSTGSVRLAGGTLSDATVDATTTVTQASGTINHLTLYGTVNAFGGTVTGGATFAAGSLFQIGGTLDGSSRDGDVTVSGDQTLGGTGEIRLADGGNVR